MFEPLPERFNYSELEHKILDFWEKNKIFEKSLEQRENCPFFSFYEGPPTVNGKPGLHHLMARTIKDTVCRYKTMQGYYVRRQAGWDTHGLPVELAVEQMLGFKVKSDIEKYGIDRFNQKCKEFVYYNIEMNQGWRDLTRRMGYWLDLDKAYITCTNEYIESVWWALKKFFDKRLIYKGFKVVPQSPTIETPLSSHELSLGYKEVRDPNLFIIPKIVDSPMKELIGSHLLVWTTTPWTLLANVAMAVGEDIDYVWVENIRKTKEGEETIRLVLAHSRLSVLDGEVKILKKFKGKELIGTEYEQIFTYAKIDKANYPDALKVLPGDFVSTEEGSGIVHIAPAFGEDDYEMSKKFKIPFLQPVTPNGHFTEDMGEFAGRAIKDFVYPDHKEEGADRDIIKALKLNGKVYKASFDYVHSYPHCWRTGNPIMYYARESWFIKSPEYRDLMIELNKQIKWQPPEIGAGRFGNWLAEVKDWSLSRDRYWGTPLPIWVSEDGTESFAIGSIAELKEGFMLDEQGNRIYLKDSNIEIDLHRPFVDKIYFKRNGKIFKRVPEVIDVWFDSGAMPFAQFHYPFENQELFEKSFPADFIAEGVDQTRGWFYTLHNIATAIFNKPAFKNIVVNELILDKKGEKMSKSKGNVIDPFEVMEKYSADAVRWYLLVNNPPWKATLFNEEDIEKSILSDFFRSLTNSYSFFALYANIDKYTGDEPEIPIQERLEIDRWIISRLNTLIRNYIKYMEDFDLTRAFRMVQSFVIDELSNWYIRRNRRRFWKGENDKDKLSAYQTLHYVLLNVSILMAPAAPFLSEVFYQRIRRGDQPESVHLLEIPVVKDELIDTELEEKMWLAQTIVRIVRSLREKAKIRTRQPLAKILIPVMNPQQRRNIQYFEDVIKEEINVKTIEYVSAETEFVKKKAKPNFKVIGKKFGKLTQAVANKIKELTHDEIVKIEAGGLKIDINGEVVTIQPEDLEIYSDTIEGWLVGTEDNLTVALDTHITEELRIEGIAREFINRIQKLRKDSNFDVTDRIEIYAMVPPEFKEPLLVSKDYISKETLAERFQLVESLENGTEIEIDEKKLLISLKKV
ncbi:isoleucine--tRNA ligase [Bacteroidetes/Chlorobi group bacterium MS-B_bin-24]|nr:MAG: isoleucine--tRNA ligase [Bacteroidetes/Chlorobi group bacterium MS-B_bin-24]